MYGGKRIAKGDRIFVFASENEGGAGLVASGIVTSAKMIAKKRRVARQTPRVSVTIRRTALAKRGLGRKELKLFSTVGPRPSSISNSIVRQRTRSPASRKKPRRSSADSFKAANFDITKWLNKALRPISLRLDHERRASIILVSSGCRKKTNATNPNSESKVNYMKASAEIPRRRSQIGRTGVYFGPAL